MCIWFVCQDMSEFEAHKVMEHDLSSFPCDLCGHNGDTSKRTMEEEKRRHPKIQKCVL